MKPSLDHVAVIPLNSIEDDRGMLTSIEGGQNIPMDIARVFYIHHVNSDRGGHAHMDTDQLAIAVHGSICFTLFDGLRQSSWTMDDPRRGLFIPRMIFLDRMEFSADAVCLVLANTHFDIRKSLRSRADFLSQISTC